jgi:hypothetical protein
MERLSKNVSTAIQLWKSINLRTPEGGEDTFSETAVRTFGTRYKFPEDILNMWYCLLKVLRSLNQCHLVTAGLHINGNKTYPSLRVLHTKVPKFPSRYMGNACLKV